MSKNHLQAARESESVRPGVGKDGFECPHCGHVAHQDWEPLSQVEVVRQISTVEPPPKVLGSTGLPAASGGDRGLPDIQQVFPWQFATCAHCVKPSVWRGEVMVYPQAKLGGTPHLDMPPEVRDLYVEAAAVAAVSTRAGAAFARVAVERLLKHLFPAVQPAKLEHLIAEAKRQGVSSPVGQMQDVVRVTGNGAVHVDDQPEDLVVLVLDDIQGPELVSKLLQAVNDLVDDLITKPRQAAELTALIPPGVQARIDQLSPPHSTDEP